MDEKSLNAFAELMIQKIESLTTKWEQPWINTQGTGLPCNIEERRYNGMNALMLFFDSEKQGYRLPVYLTFNQAKNNNILIKKGAESFPVAYWNMSIRHKKNGSAIIQSDYLNLSPEEKKEYKVTPYMKHYNVFNVAQTNMQEVRPDILKKFEIQFNPQLNTDVKNMFDSQVLDNMIEKKSWYVPIEFQNQNRAYYSPTRQLIVLPVKEQFKDGESFYTTMLHEMAHSTGHPSLLNRDLSVPFGSKSYGKEELVAELTAALAGKSIGISSGIREENVEYLKSWLDATKKDPKFIFSILSDVNKATGMIMEKLDNNISLKEKEDIKNEMRAKEDKKLPGHKIKF
jgi:antirestriction protein ArdC